MCDVNWANITLHSILPQAPTHTVFCCPDIDNVTLNVWPICTKKRCGKKVTPTPGAKIVRCSSCSSTMLLSKCECGPSAELQLTKDSKNLTFSVFSNVLDEFFHANVRHLYKDDMDSLTEKLLQLDNTDFSYNAKKIVTKMSEHLPNDVGSDDTASTQYHIYFYTVNNDTLLTAYPPGFNDLSKCLKFKSDY